MDRRELPAETRKRMLDLAASCERVAKALKAFCGEEETPARKKPEVDGGQLELPLTMPEEKKEAAVTLEEVRKVLAEKSRDGFTKDVRELIASFGVRRLSAIDPKDYGEVLKRAEGIGDA